MTYNIFKRNVALTALLLGSLATGLSCGEKTLPEAGKVTFFPASLSIGSPSNQLRDREFIVRVTDKDGAAVSNTRFYLQVPFHNRTPFSGAAGPVSVLDENGDPLVIDSPDGSGNQGTLTTGTTDSNGDGRFTLRFPTGGDYTFSAYVVTVRTSAEITITVASE